MSNKKERLGEDNVVLIHESNIRVNDVLCGRGTKYCTHAGNQSYHALVKHFIPDYASCRKKTEKTGIAKAIVDAVYNSKPPGRFLTKFKNGSFSEMENSRAREKTSQLLRENVMIGKTNHRTMYQKKKFDKFMKKRHCATIRTASSIMESEPPFFSTTPSIPPRSVINSNPNMFDTRGAPYVETMDSRRRQIFPTSYTDSAVNSCHSAPPATTTSHQQMHNIAPPFVSPCADGDPRYHQTPFAPQRVFKTNNPRSYIPCPPTNNVPFYGPPMKMQTNHHNVVCVPYSSCVQRCHGDAMSALNNIQQNCLPIPSFERKTSLCTGRPPDLWKK